MVDGLILGVIIEILAQEEEIKEAVNRTSLITFVLQGSLVAAVASVFGLLYKSAINAYKEIAETHKRIAESEKQRANALYDKLIECMRSKK